MLAELHIDNLLLLARAHIEFAPGLNAFTGETGAGKSLLVDALNFVLGARGDAGLVRPGAAQAEVTARFLIHDAELCASLQHDLGIAFEELPAKNESAELVVARTLPTSGRGRAHVNGRPIALPALKELGERLLDIHGQHENQSLLRPLTRLEILDRYAGAMAERDAVKQAHHEAHAAARALAELRRAARERRGREDLLRFQLKELDDARLDDVEPQSLEDEVKLLRGAEKICAAALLAQNLLDGDAGDEAPAAALLVARAHKAFQTLGEAGPDVADIRERLDALLSDARDIAALAGGLADKARSDPERLADLEDRRELLRTLERKHGYDLAGLLALREKLRGELRDFDQIDIRTEERERAVQGALTALKQASERLSRKRKSAARDLEKQVQSELAGLGLKGAELKVLLAPNDGATPPASADDELETEAARMVPAQLKATGQEHAEILFTANPELEARPLKECASGGEISRVMLALKTVLARVSGADRLPVVVFDEVDAGVGGRLGAALGKKLRELAGVRQVLCVTHQPQLAVYAERQFKVEKKRVGQGTSVSVLALEGERRIDEIAQMLRGEGASAHTKEEAATMLKEAQNGKRR
jgi:DNA repair protein RecN (Recombination protein N)